MAVSFAKGSTEISYWMPGGKAYEVMIEKINEAKELVLKDGSIGKVYFVWLQGESDAVAGKSKEYYKEKITGLCRALKKYAGIEKFGIIRVGRFTNDSRDLEIIGAQSEICKKNNDFVMLTDISTELNRVPKYMNPYVRVHYSAEGLEKLGSMAGAKLGELRKTSRL